MAGLIVASVRKKDQLTTLHRAISYVKEFSVAIDGGANVGDWLAVMVSRFTTVHAFEPNEELCDVLNAKYSSPFQSVHVHHSALWSHDCKVSLHSNPRAPDKKRAMFCKEGGSIAAVAIDSLHLNACGLIKLDLEGAECLAIQGAVRTIKKFHPVMIVECKATSATTSRSALNEEKPGRLLKPLGYFEAFRFGPDRVYSWDK